MKILWVTLKQYQTWTIFVLPNRFLKKIRASMSPYSCYSFYFPNTNIIHIFHQPCISFLHSFQTRMCAAKYLAALDRNLIKQTIWRWSYFLLFKCILLCLCVSSVLMPVFPYQTHTHTKHRINQSMTIYQIESCQ